MISTKQVIVSAGSDRDCVHAEALPVQAIDESKPNACGEMVRMELVGGGSRAKMPAGNLTRNLRKAIGSEVELVETVFTSETGAVAVIMCIDGLDSAVASLAERAERGMLDGFEGWRWIAVPLRYGEHDVSMDEQFELTSVLRVRRTMGGRN